ncbi:flagellar basal body L-ring protein FlgH [Variovorax arabinosiphilus]|uniref:flagellar basal body L-ring protein FlgH n=1 Tax=Variovorax arabinosiphilus TaxID=3053498 RepID=UPI0025764363|nr:MULTISPECIES: flagellar basal body L-ring protein FlgH [unclassified Variovorax]MDM0122185.1 flagellar basal body L-ring protein FlgH [Variovorax sp. J2L1-78]MDM0131286.1 flagellar basal body L-ring protein FlgH [Variovorax sp. J2L1-63]MDM0234948.1 flagellar basal body L-ring protein FlgH [Variovorax sp. J2R1-6]
MNRALSLGAIRCGLVCSLLGVLSIQHAAAESLYLEGAFRPLTADNKAFKIGDALTVQVFENSSATSSANTGTRRANDISGSVTHESGRRVGQLGIGVTGDFDGGGRTQRTNKLLATLTVTVLEVLPNRELRVAGEQLLTVNDEVQKVNLEGRVRPQDISDGNVVLSTRLADAHITYVGEGDVSDRARRSAWRRIVDWLGL